MEARRSQAGRSPGWRSVPLWVGGSWVDVLVLVNPTASSGSLSVDVFNCAGCSPMPAPTTVPVPLPARGMGLVFLSNFAGAYPNGNATISCACGLQRAACGLGA